MPASMPVGTDSSASAMEMDDRGSGLVVLSPILHLLSGITVFLYLLPDIPYYLPIISVKTFYAANDYPNWQGSNQVPK
jgi:hypothetical protein